MTDRNVVTAACLTPPAAGGIAVVQVVGDQAATILNPLLKSKRMIDVENLRADELRLCRLVDGEQTIDDAVVASRRDDTGQRIIELSLHGGPRIVQRTLLLLKKAGAQIVDARYRAMTVLSNKSLFDQEVAETLLEAVTRPVASLIAESSEILPAEIRSMEQDLNAGQIESVRQLLNRRLKQSRRVQRVVRGVRVALKGSPNSGKSTLANVLSGRETAVVSVHPGTTRDWTEHPCAIDGVPFTFVDTAGLRESSDPIEQEAIRRGRDQVEPADLVIHVIDGSQPLMKLDRESLQGSGSGGEARSFFVWNKADLGLDASHGAYLKAESPLFLRISALTGEGVDTLSDELLAELDLVGWRKTVGAPFTERQHRAYLESLSALAATGGGVPKAIRCLNSVINQQFS